VFATTVPQIERPAISSGIRSHGDESDHFSNGGRRLAAQDCPNIGQSVSLLASGSRTQDCSTTVDDGTCCDTDSFSEEIGTPFSDGCLLFLQ
jgi:hypothetical protein